MKTRQNIIAICYDSAGRMLSTGTNKYLKTHPVQAFYAQKAGLPEKIYLHAEIDALMRVKKGKPYRMVVIRKNRFGHLRPSESCRICKAAMKDYGIVQIDCIASENEYVNA